MTADPAVVVAGDAHRPDTDHYGSWAPRVRASSRRIVPQYCRWPGPPRRTDGFLARLSSDAFGQMLRNHLVASEVQSATLSTPTI